MLWQQQFYRLSDQCRGLSTPCDHVNRYGQFRPGQQVESHILPVWGENPKIRTEYLQYYIFSPEIRITQPGARS